mmetsp:Transcript_30397/g.46625  ORF Transcript_30397/g.46625 Transcript_30397/m.46625 type:complete len:134 (+) Transcript_30397:327-728(+)
MIDANKNGSRPDSKLRRAMDSISMTNIHHLIFGDNCLNTCQQGTEQINHIYGCPIVANQTVRAGVLPFKYNIDTDHRGLYVDVKVDNIFKSVTAELHRPKERKMSSANLKQSDTSKESDCLTLKWGGGDDSSW